MRLMELSQKNFLRQLFSFATAGVAELQRLRLFDTGIFSRVRLLWRKTKVALLLSDHGQRRCRHNSCGREPPPMRVGLSRRGKAEGQRRKRLAHCNN